MMKCDRKSCMCSLRPKLHEHGGQVRKAWVATGINELLLYVHLHMKQK